MPMKIAALFSGQGSQYPGMGKTLCDTYPEARQVYELASDILGFDVAKISAEGSPEELSRTLVSQPAIFTLSMAAYEVAKKILPPVSAVAGHSLGEFAALCCAGSYSLEDGVRLIKARASAMDKAASETPGAMYAIIGSDEGAVSAACDAATGFVKPVNFNLRNQTVISGEETAAAAAADILSAAGARTVRLAVSSAFHTELMKPAAEQFLAGIGDVVFHKPQIDFYSNLTGQKLIPEDFPAYFAEHMVSPVRFSTQIGAMANDGLNFCVEFGPGKSASTLAKKNIRSLSVHNVESPETVEKLRELLI